MSDPNAPRDEYPTRDAGAPGLTPPPPYPVPAPPAYQPPYSYQPRYPAPPAYGAPMPYGAYAGYAPTPRTNPLAVVSFVSSLVGFVLSWTFVFGVGLIVGVITGHIALGQIARNREGGRGLAIAGVVIGWVAIGLGVLGVALFALVFGAASTSTHSVV